MLHNRKKWFNASFLLVLFFTLNAIAELNSEELTSRLIGRRNELKTGTIQYESYIFVTDEN
jgi:hypothetical protein